MAECVDDDSVTVDMLEICDADNIGEPAVTTRRHAARTIRRYADPRAQSNRGLLIEVSAWIGVYPRCFELRQPGFKVLKRFTSMSRARTETAMAPVGI